jgi:hypothetical protein
MTNMVTDTPLTWIVVPLIRFTRRVYCGEILTFCNGWSPVNFRKRGEEGNRKREADGGKIPAIGKWGKTISGP